MLSSHLDTTVDADGGYREQILATLENATRGDGLRGAPMRARRPRTPAARPPPPLPRNTLRNLWPNLA